jgi:hypothetical protein
MFNKSKKILSVFLLSPKVFISTAFSVENMPAYKRHENKIFKPKKRFNQPRFRSFWSTTFGFESSENVLNSI